MTFKKAQELLRAILKFQEASADLANEGNSGEFHDEVEASRCIRDLKDAYAEFQAVFDHATGYTPICVDLVYEYKQGAKMYMTNWIFAGFPGRYLFALPPGVKITQQDRASAYA